MQGMIFGGLFMILIVVFTIYLLIKELYGENGKER